MAQKKTPPRGTRSTQISVDVELGVTNVMPASTWLNWTGSSIAPPGQFVIGKDPLAPSQDDLVFMLRRDGQARAMLSLLTLPIRAAFANSQWMPAGQGEGEDEAAFANAMFSLPANAGGMEVPSSLFLRQLLLALPHGFSAFEIVRQVPETGPLAGMITLKKLGYRDPRTVSFLTDEHGNYTGFKQVTDFAGRHYNITIPAIDSFYYAANEEENPMYGVSMFEPAYQHYQMKRKMYYIGHLAAQLAAVPGRIGEVPMGATPRQIEDFKRGIANFAFNTAMVVPPNFKVTPFNGNNGFNFLSIIDHHNMMMATSILAKFLQQEDRQVLIDNGKADASADMFVQMLEAVTNEIAEALTTRLMPQFIDFNFGSGLYPVFKFAPLTDANKEAIMNLFMAMVAQPTLNCTPEFMRMSEMKLADRLGYDIDYDEVAKEEQRAAEEQAQAAAEAQQHAQAQSQGTNLDGSPVESEPLPSAGGIQPPKPSVNGPASNSSGPIVKASASTEDQQLAMGQIYSALSTLFADDEPPTEFTPEGDVRPELGEL